MCQLLQDGVARPDRLCLGLDTDPDGALIDGHGRAQERLFTIGPMRRGQLWESTAVPEIRVEAERLAERLGAIAERVQGARCDSCSDRRAPRRAPTQGRRRPPRRRCVR